ncbi:hypothetical protein CapIbe_006706 [Capra ibex]
MVAALARLGLRSVKQVRVQFCSFEKNVESTRTFHKATSIEHRLITHSAHLTAHTTQEMLTAFTSHIQAKGAAGSRDKPSPGTRR